MAESDQMALFGGSETASNRQEEQRIVSTLQRYNAAYRAGKPLVSDEEYDALTEALRRLNPRHSFLLQVEPEALGDRAEVRHPTPMLSTQKAYTHKELTTWIARMEKARAELGLQEELVYRVTPKLDGLAGRDEQGFLRHGAMAVLARTFRLPGREALCPLEGEVLASARS